MAEVDNKVVSIQFDNAAFQKKMSETITSLDKLRSSLDMAAATRGLTDLSAASKTVDLSPMGVSVEGISAKFAALATVGITVLSNIVTKAMSAGAQITKSLSLGPVMQGFQEYETNMNSIQTILANTKSKGATLEDVNAALDKLNTYSDQTIYNFSQMTRNIGTFTAAGIGLDDSVNAIKGIANLAAISGSNSEQASTAMYQLSQALAAGKVNLMDWNSVVNAGMGGEIFKKALFETGKAMRTITDVPLGATFEEWEEKGGTFREQMQSGWLTADVLSTTLSSFSGDLDAAALSALGFGDAAAQEMLELGKLGQAAATEVKTVTQLMDTVKEAIGSGWSTSFRIIIGDFAEAKDLFTDISSAIGEVVGRSADSRNAILQDWKNFGGEGGGRTALIDGLKVAIAGLGTILKPITEAFREIFPKKTAADLLYATAAFVRFAEKIKITEETADKVKEAFKGFFAIISIGWEILKGVARVFFAIAGGLWKIFSPLLNIVSGTGSLISAFHGVAVEGKGIETFFDGLVAAMDGVFDALSGVIKGIGEFISELGIFQAAAEGLGNLIDLFGRVAAAVRDFFDSLSFGSKGSDETKKANENLNETGSLAERLLQALKNVFGQIGDLLGKIGGGIADAFKGLGNAISSALSTGDLSTVLDVLKVGLLGGIFLKIRKFIKEFSLFDLGGDLGDKIKDLLTSVTDSFKALQTNLKADTLRKIAIAIAILTISIIALSLINAEALAKAMAAIAVGLTQLTAVMIVMEKNIAGSGLKLAAAAAGMVLMAAAMTLLVIPIKILSTMDVGELAKGIIGVSVAMLVMAKAVSMIGGDTVGIVRAGISMIFISLALIVLAKAIKSFAEMNLTEMAFGLAQAALGIGLLILALKGMPDDVAKKGVGLLILALALRSLAKVVQLFAGISFGVLAKGFISISIGLGLIGIAMRQFPNDMVKQSAGLIVMSAALFIIGKVVEQIGNLPFGTLAKGLIALTLMLGLLVVSVKAMEGSGSGVAAMILAAAGLYIIGKAIESVGKIPIGEMLKGLLGLAAALAVLALASVAAPGLLLLGVALLAIGAGLALVGAGVALAGKGFELMAKFGGAGMEHVITAMQAVIREIPGFVSAFVKGLIDAFVEIGNEMPKLIDTVVKVLSALLDAFIQIMPKVKEAITELISNIIDVFIEAIPQFVEAGFAVLTGWLTGIRDNIGEIVSLAIQIVTEFLDAIAGEMPRLVESVTNFIATAFEEIAFGLGALMPRLMIGVGRSFLEGFWTGLTQELGKVGETIGKIIRSVINWFKERLGISSPSKVMMEIGKFVIQGLINGIKAMFNLLRTVFVEIPGKILGWIGNALGWLVQKGKDILSGLLKGLAEGVGAVITWVQRLPGRILSQLSNAGTLLLEVGRDLIRGLWGGINEMKDWVLDKVAGFAGSILDGIKGFFGIGSPSKVFMQVGIHLGEGLAIGIRSMTSEVTGSALTLGNSVKDGWERAKVALSASLSDMDEFNPTITPVIDMKDIKRSAEQIEQMFGKQTVTPGLSVDHANLILHAVSDNQNGSDSEPVSTGPTEIKYEQNIYAPTELSAAEIYRGTKGLIAVTKEEIGAA